MLDEVDDAALVLEGLFLFLAGALVDEVDGQVLVEEGHGLEPLGDGAGHELDALGLEDGGVGVEGDRRAGLAALGGGGARFGDLALHFSAVFELELVAVAPAVDFDDHLGRQGVDHRDAHAVEAARDLVALAAELAAGVEDREHHLSSAFPLVRTRRIGVDGDAAAVVFDATAAVILKNDVDGVAEARHGFIDRVVDDFPDEVMQTSEARGPDVHTRTLANGVETFEDLNVLRTVIGRRFLRSGGGRGIGFAHCEILHSAPCQKGDLARFHRPFWRT